MPKTGTSQAMPTMAPPPPAAGLNRAFDQCMSSPVRWSSVTARVITAGTRISFLIETSFVMTSPQYEMVSSQVPGTPLHGTRFVALADPGGGPVDIDERLQVPAVRMVRKRGLGVLDRRMVGPLTAPGGAGLGRPDGEEHPDQAFHRLPPVAAADGNYIDYFPPGGSNGPTPRCHRGRGSPRSR